MMSERGKSEWAAYHTDRMLEYAEAWYALRAESAGDTRTQIAAEEAAYCLLENLGMLCRFTSDQMPMEKLRTDEQANVEQLVADAIAYVRRSTLHKDAARLVMEDLTPDTIDEMADLMLLRDGMSVAMQVIEFVGCESLDSSPALDEQFALTTGLEAAADCLLQARPDLLVPACEVFRNLRNGLQLDVDERLHWWYASIDALESLCEQSESEETSELIARAEAAAVAKALQTEDDGLDDFLRWLDGMPDLAWSKLKDRGEAGSDISGHVTEETRTEPAGLGAENVPLDRILVYNLLDQDFHEPYGPGETVDETMGAYASMEDEESESSGSDEGGDEWKPLTDWLQGPVPLRLWGSYASGIAVELDRDLEPEHLEVAGEVYRLSRMSIPSCRYSWALEESDVDVFRELWVARAGESHPLNLKIRGDL